MVKFSDFITIPTTKTCFSFFLVPFLVQPVQLVDISSKLQKIVPLQIQKRVTSITASVYETETM